MTRPCRVTRFALFLLVIAAAWFAPSAFSQSSGSLALTPPMGWNRWNKFGCNVSDKLIREIADAVVSSGMQSAGYQYVNMDDWWQVTRDAWGTMCADPARSPSSTKPLAAYAAGRGSKLAMYTD